MTPLPSDAPWWARWLVGNWRTIYLQVSSWFIAAIGLLQTSAVASELWVPQLKPYLSGHTLHLLTLSLAIAAMVSRFIKQPSIAPPTVVSAAPATLGPEVPPPEGTKT
jgi:hypothetical protein